MRKKVSDLDFFLARVKKTRGCWIWTSSKNSAGYGEIKSRGRDRIQAHRFSFQHFVGEIPKGMFVCHRCDTPLCVKPKHLFLGTAQDNWLDAIKKGRAKTMQFTKEQQSRGGKTTGARYGDVFVKIAVVALKEKRKNDPEFIEKFRITKKEDTKKLLKKYGKDFFSRIAKRGISLRKNWTYARRRKYGLKSWKTRVANLIESSN